MTVALRCHAWSRTSVFWGDVQQSLMDMPFDGTHLFGDKPDSALERFKDSWATARSLGLSSATRPPQSAFRPFCGHKRGALSRPLPSHPATHVGQPMHGEDAESYVAVGQGTTAPAAVSKPSKSVPHSHPVGDRIRHHLPHWEHITTDGWVLQIIRKGYSLPFESAPPYMPPSLHHLPEDHLVLLRQEVTALLAKGAIERLPVPEVGCGCYSCYFLIPKKNKGLRPILDLRDLNYYFLKKEKFKMLALAQVLSALDPGGWMVALGLQDAYFHIPILPAHRRYQQFVVVHEHFQFTMLPLALPAPLGCSQK
ncbi:hypothetical protein NDU88_004991 [Pleurodeles waltl]|uniref:Reverse transcriptase domain-containing protein n=1 Tax=Pleurodeles waltl TaxID=8319 RepID=A0AAV7T9P0_PLEWA|nr:hypothetical protein NDU88_004991 [Pleurodeles waltl]